MTEHITSEIAVIGAGVIGLTVALRLAQDGRTVLLLDPAEPGSGASYGNAGAIADYAVEPVGTPELLMDLPSLLFDRNSPVAIRRGGYAALTTWLSRFAVQSLPGPARRNGKAIAALVRDARTRWQALAAEVGGSDILQHKGVLYLYATSAEFRAAEKAAAKKRALGAVFDLIDPAALSALEPNLPPAAGAAFYSGAATLNDPGRMMSLLGAAVAAAGVEHRRQRADRLERQVDGVTVHGPGMRLHARRVVIAAGAHSRGLAFSAGDRVPLDTERGYHVEWDMATPLLSRPVCPTARGFYLCPMSGRLRAAGTVELGGLRAPPSPHRVAKLIEGARSIFPDLGTPAREWMGFRPSLPDSLPVIGPSKSGTEIIHAYGHGHIGITLAPMTAALVADIVAGREPALPLAPYRPGRF